MGASSKYIHVNLHPHRCRICGTRFESYPEYVWRHHERWYCSYSCYRVDEKKRLASKNKGQRSPERIQAAIEEAEAWEEHLAKPISAFR